MSFININGKNYSGNNIVINNGKVTINGKDVTPDRKEINISVQGNIDELKADMCTKVIVTGDVKNINTLSGNVEVRHNVHGNIQTMFGDVDCGHVEASISTMSGDIKYRKS